MRLDWLKWGFGETDRSAGGLALADAPPLPDPSRVSSRRPDLAFLDEPEEDRVDLTSAAAFSIASAQTDPRRMSQSESIALADFLLRHRAIDGADHLALSYGPDRHSPRAPYRSGPDLPRDMIGAWQERLSVALGSSDATGVDLASRALRVLGRVEVGRAG